MRSAPSVSYPVGRSRLAGRFLFGAWALGVTSCALWCVQAGNSPWRTAILALTLLAATLGALHAVRLGEASRLLWDGMCWQIERAGGPRLSAPTVVVHLDLQALMLLRLQLKTGAMQWAWAERASAPALWPGIRRALHARPDASVKSAASPQLSS